RPILQKQERGGAARRSSRPHLRSGATAQHERSRAARLDAYFAQTVAHPSKWRRRAKLRRCPTSAAGAHSARIRRAGGFQGADTDEPTLSPSPRTDSWVISATMGWPASSPTRARLPIVTIEVTLARSRFCADPTARSSGESRVISHGYTLTATRPSAGAVAA